MQAIEVKESERAVGRSLPSVIHSMRLNAA